MSAPAGVVILFYAIVVIAVLLLYIVVNWLARRYESRRATDRLIRIRPPMPRRYAGCITCEGAEALSNAALIRHQTRDHAGGIVW